MINWQDSDYINFKVQIIVNSVTFTITDIYSQVLPISTPTTVFFRIPIISSLATTTSASIQACILAIDYSFATTQSCVQLPQLVNNSTFTSNLDLLRDQLIN